MIDIVSQLNQDSGILDKGLDIMDKYFNRDLYLESLNIEQINSVEKTKQARHKIDATVLLYSKVLEYHHKTVEKEINAVQNLDALSFEIPLMIKELLSQTNNSELSNEEKEQKYNILKLLLEYQAEARADRHTSLNLIIEEKEKGFGNMLQSKDFPTLEAKSD